MQRRNLIKSIALSSCAGIGFTNTVEAKTDSEKSVKKEGLPSQPIGGGGGDGCSSLKPFCDPLTDYEDSQIIYPTRGYALTTEVGSSLQYEGGSYSPGADNWAFYFVTNCTGINHYNHSDGWSQLDIFDGQHGLEISVEDQHESDVSTTAHTDTDWGIGIIGDEYHNNDFAEEMMEAQTSVTTLFSDLSGAVVTATDLYNTWQEVNGFDPHQGVDEEWPSTQPLPKKNVGHCVAYTHTIPGDLYGDTISVEVTNHIDKALYFKDGVRTSNKTPTETYSKTFEYEIYIPSPSNEEEIQN